MPSSLLYRYQCGMIFKIHSYPYFHLLNYDVVRANRMWIAFAVKQLKNEVRYEAVKHTRLLYFEYLVS